MSSSVTEEEATPPLCGYTRRVTSIASERPLRRDAERNRQRILDAAAEVFAARGLDVSLDDIARHACLGVGTVYRRFPTKDALVEALFDQVIDEMVATVTRAVEADDPWEGLVTGLTEVCASEASNRGLREMLSSSRYGQVCKERARAELNPVVEAGLARAKDAGYLRADIDRVDMMLVELMIGSVAQYTQNIPGAWRRYLQIVLDGLRARPGLDPLPVPPPTDEQMDAAMSWHLDRRTTGS